MKPQESTSRSGSDFLTSIRYPNEFQLKMPLIGPNGVSVVWLMKEVGQLHSRAICEVMDRPPAQWFDAEGHHVQASVLASTLTGSTLGFQPDTSCKLRMVVVPCAQTGWLSQTDLESPSGERVCVEIMTSFSRSKGASEAALTRPRCLSVPPSADRDPSGARAYNLNRLGEIELCRARKSRTALYSSTRLNGEDRVTDLGNNYFAAFQDLLTEAEQGALSHASYGAQLVARRVHYYAELGPRSTLDTFTEVATNVHNLPSWFMTFTFVRRRSDKRIVSACESSYRVE